MACLFNMAGHLCGIGDLILSIGASDGFLSHAATAHRWNRVSIVGIAGGQAIASLGFNIHPDMTYMEITNANPLQLPS